MTIIIDPLIAVVLVALVMPVNIVIPLQTDLRRMLIQDRDPD